MKQRTRASGIRHPLVAAVFRQYAEPARDKLLQLRELIYEVAASTEGVGKLEETLRWGEPADLTTQSNSGSMIRIDSKKSSLDTLAMYFHCQTNLVESFRSEFGSKLNYEKNRALVFSANDELPINELSVCIARALTYKLSKKNTVVREKF